MINYRIYFIRHGLTRGNEEGRYIGITDLPLSAAGKEQIVSAVRGGGYPEVYKYYAPPLRRCMETAEIIYPDVVGKFIPALAEMDFGDFEYKTAAELENVPAYTDWLGGWRESGVFANPLEVRPPRGESYGEFTARCIRGLSEVFADMQECGVKKAAVVTHGGVITSLVGGNGLPKCAPRELMLKPGEGIAADMSAFLWGRGNTFEVVGKI